MTAARDIEDDPRVLSEDEREQFEERAAIAEFDGGLPRTKAETVAWAELKRQLDRVERQLSDLKRGAVLRFSEAVARLPMRDKDAREWLRSEGLVTRVEGREFVHWGAVEERFRPKPKKPIRRNRQMETALPRVDLT